MTYSDFLKSKRITVAPSGIVSASDVSATLFPFQQAIVRWALRRGKCALFEDCGLGKTIQELEWARHIVQFGGVDKLLTVAPLAVSRQIIREADKFGYAATLIEADSDSRAGINVTNYEKLHKFDLGKFEAVVLDESSILKSQDGKTRNDVIKGFSRAKYKLAGTATPAPNDYMELGNHAEFLGIMSRSEMLSTFFCHDGGDTSKWRLKGHAADDFWRWVCSWAVNIRKPSDLGFDDGGFILPPITVNEISVESDTPSEGMLFPMPASSMKERRDARRGSLPSRVKAGAEIANSVPGEQFLVWCDLNAESHALTKAIDGAVEISGADSDGSKLIKAQGFLEGGHRCLVTKPEIFGFGMNWQHCRNVIFVGLSDSFESYYQAVRRCWRFGQTKPVNVWIVTSKQEGAVVANIKRKEADANRMAARMVALMADMSRAEIGGTERQEIYYRPKTPMLMPSFL